MRFNLTLTIFILSFCLCFSNNAIAQTGSLDSSFGDNGKVYNSQEGIANAITTQRDGKILVAGEILMGHNSMAVRRYNVDGSVDKENFGNKGNAIADFGKPAIATAIFIDSANEIITAGIASDDFALAKFKNNGTLDSTFGIDGKVTTDFEKKNDEIISFKILTNGKILAVGNAKYGTENLSEIAIARYYPNGTLDSNFGINGKIKTRLNSDGLDYGTALITQGKKFVVAGYSHNQVTDYDFVLIRYTSKGEIDSSFGINGYLFADFGGHDYANSMAVQSNGKIVVSGYSAKSGGSHSVLARYTMDGKLDSSFGTNGKFNLVIGKEHDENHAMIIQNDDKILITGTTTIANKYDMFIEAFTKNGKIDSTFGSFGKTIIDFVGGNNDESYCITIQQDGKLLIGGYTQQTWARFALARFQGYPNTNRLNDDLNHIVENSLCNRRLFAYPNPAKTNATISFKANGKYTITVMDLSGRLLLTRTGIAINGENVIRLDISKYPSDIYFITMTDHSFHNQSVKLIKY